MITEKPVISEKLKEHLYPVFLRQFSMKYFHAVNIRDISKESGISTGTIYQYFSSNEDLLFPLLTNNCVILSHC
jgi:AcrR family transcriptional regulator